MKKIRFSVRWLHKLTVPLVGAVLVVLTLAAWTGIKHSAEQAEAQYFQRAYEVIDRYLTAYYNNDPDALLDQFPDFVLKAAMNEAAMDEETFRSYMAETMNEHQARRTDAGAVYEWTYLGIDEEIDWDWMLHIVNPDVMISHTQQKVSVRLTETVDGVTNEYLLGFMMFERDEVWYTDLYNIVWPEKGFFQSDKMAPVNAVTRWMKAWYDNQANDLMQEIHPDVLDGLTGDNRRAWESNLRQKLENKAAEDEARRAEYSYVMSANEELSGNALTTLQQQYSQQFGLTVTEARTITMGIFKHEWISSPLEGVEDKLAAYTSEASYTAVAIDGQWYVDMLELPGDEAGIWKLSDEA